MLIACKRAGRRWWFGLLAVLCIFGVGAGVRVAVARCQRPTQLTNVFNSVKQSSSCGCGVERVSAGVPFMASPGDGVGLLPQTVPSTAFSDFGLTFGTPFEQRLGGVELASGSSSLGDFAGFERLVAPAPSARIPGEIGFGQVGLPGDPVIADTGEYVFQSNDMVCPHDGRDFAIKRIYRSLTNGPSGTADFGSNFHSNLWIQADEIDSTTVDVYLGTGKTYRFTWNSGAGVWDAPTGYEQYKLEKIPTTGSDYYYQVTDNDGEKYIFEEETTSTSTPYMVVRTENRYGQGEDYNYTSGYLSSIDLNNNLSITITRLPLSHHITLISDSQGREVHYAYTSHGASGRLRLVSDLCGTCSPNTAVSFHYNGSNHINEIYNGDGDTIRSISYTSGMVDSYTDYFSNTWSFAYTATTATVTDPVGVDTVYTIDANNNVTQMVAADGETTEATYDYSYDGKYRLTEIDNPDGTTVSYTHDNRNRVKTIDLMANSTTINMVEQSFYDDGRIAYQIDAMNHRTDYTYNGNKELTAIQYPDGSEKTFTYSGTVNGLPDTMTDEAGVERTYQYDANGFNTQVILANGTADEMVELSQTFDLAGRIIAKKLSSQIATTYDYDNSGQVVESVQGIYTTDYGYDANGNMTSKTITDTSGTPTEVEDWSYTYDAMGSKLTETNELVSETTTYTYDKLNRLETTTDPAGVVTRGTYDERGRVSSVQIKTGTSTWHTQKSVTYDSMNRVLVINDGASNATERSYDVFGRLARVTDPTGDYTQYAYDDLGRVMTATRFAGGGTAVSKREYTYDNRNRVRKVRQYADADGMANNTLDAVTETSYDTAGKEAWKKVAISSTVMLETDKSYNSNTGRLTTVTDPEDKDTSLTYYVSTGLKKKVMNPMDVGPEDSYDDYGRVSQTTYPDGSYVTYAYNHRGQKTMEIHYSDQDVALKKQSWEYDGAGRKTEVRLWANANSGSHSSSDMVTTYTYGTTSDTGRLVSMTGPTGHTTTYDYDAFYGDREQITFPDGSYIQYSNFDGNGKPQTVTRVEKTPGEFDKTAVKQYEFNSMGRTVKITDNGPDGTPNNSDDHEVLLEYDANGRIGSVTDAAGMVMQEDYDDFGRKVKETRDKNGIARVTEFAYDNAGRMTKMTAYKDSPSTGKEETLYSYDGRGLMTSATYEETGTVTMTYDDVGNMTERSDEAGVRVVFTYDADTNRLTERAKYGASTDIEKYEYDQLGQLTLAEKGTTGNPDSVSKSVFTYNDLGQLASEDQTVLDSVTRSIDYTYHTGGTLDSVVSSSAASEPDALNYDLTYDSRDRVTSMQELDDTAIADYKWRGDAVFSRQITCDYPGATKPVFETDYTYDGLMRVTQMSTTHQTSDQAASGHNEIQTLNYTYDDASNPLSMLENNTTWNSAEASYTYDTLNRVVSASLKDTQTWTAATSAVSTFDYDDVGNRDDSTCRGSAVRSYDHDDANCTTAIGPTGSMLSQTYDLAGNLTQTAAIYDGKGYSLVYDHNNRLIEVWNSAKTQQLFEYVYDALGRMIASTDEVNNETLYYFYDGVKRIVETDDTGTRLRQYYRGPVYVDELVRMDDVVKGRPYYFVQDRMWSITREIDRAGAVVGSIAYDTYGLGHYRRSGGRGDLNLDGAVTSNDVTYAATVVSGSVWNPIADMDDDGDVDSRDAELIASKEEAWDGDGTGDAIVASAFSPVGNPFMFQGRPRFAIDTAKYEDDGASGDVFGLTVAVSGNYAVVGAPTNDTSGDYSGVAYVYRFTGSDWVPVKQLVASDAGSYQTFGQSVDIDGDVIIVGADSEGAAYIFYRNEGGEDNWGQVAKLVGSSTDYYGDSVAVSGDTAIVSEYGNDDAGDTAGAAYVYYRDEGGSNAWGQVKELTASDAAAGDVFGSSVAIDGDAIVVGAPGDDDGGAYSGSAYVFERDSGGSDNWGQTGKLTAANAAAYDYFGAASIDGAVIVIGASGSDEGGTDWGAAYVYVKPGSTWSTMTEDAVLTASDGAANDNFGVVAIDGDTIVVGATGDDDNGYASGSVYIFEKPGGGWADANETVKRTASDGDASDSLGQSVAIEGNRILSGAQFADGAASGSGAVYAFGRDFGGSGNWGETQKVVAQVPLQPAMPAYTLNFHGARFMDPVQGTWTTRDPLLYNQVDIRSAIRRSSARSQVSPARIQYAYMALEDSPTKRTDPLGMCVHGSFQTLTRTRTCRLHWYSLTSAGIQNCYDYQQCLCETWVTYHTDCAKSCVSCGTIPVPVPTAPAPPFPPTPSNDCCRVASALRDGNTPPPGACSGCCIDWASSPLVRAGIKLIFVGTIPPGSWAFVASFEACLDALNCTSL